MGKYIIDVGDAYVRHGLERTLTIPVRINDHEDHWMDTRIPLTPYTEPDIEKVIEEAYKDGYKTARERHYQKGLSDAWAAARKIATMPNKEFINSDILDLDPGESIFTKYTASEAIEKIRQYEQEKEKQITKGDVVRIKSAPEIEILVTCADGDYISGIALTEMDDNCEIGDQYTDILIHKVEKTGKHYEIAAVLAKMKEES